MNTIKRYLLSVLFLCVSLSAFSQASVYPIQLSAAMLPPYTNCMGDYFSNGRVQLKVIVRDMSRYDASLDYSISVKIKQGGRVVLASKGPLKRRFSQAQIVNDISLKDLFSDRSNYTVTGGANNFFDNGYCLEEGSYEFEYQLFDKNNGKMPLSEPFSVYCYLTQAEPPVGVFPEDGKCYEGSELPQTFLFQWIDPIAIGPQNRSYELHIKENGTDMNFTGNMFSTQDAPSSMEFYNQNVYNNNFVLINNSSGKFKEGNTYYWYVQTKSVADGIHGQNAYKNNGKSQTYSFSIGNCHQEEPKINFDDSKAKNKAQSKVKIELDEVKVEGDVVTPKWELKSNKDNELICGFKIYCYKAGGNPDDASEVKNMTFICNKFKEGYVWTDNLNSSVLEKGVEYFCFVRPVVKDGAIGLKSNEISFKLASPNASSSSKNEDDGCGVDLKHRPCEELLTTVPKYFFANDGHQVILVDKTTKLEGDAFTGAGIITPAWLKNMLPDVMPLTGLNVEFEKIKINSDGYLCEGEIKVVSDPATNLYFDLNELVDFKAGSDAAAKQREVYTKEVDKKEDIKGDVFNGQIVHEKSTGDLYAVPMGGGTPEKVAKCLNKREYCPLQYRGALNDAGIYLRFDVDATLNDGYSPYIDKEAKPFTAENILNGYISSGSDYIQPWISMVQGETKYIKAYFEGGSVDPDDVEFYLISQNSIALLEKSYENGYFKVRIYGGQPTRSLQIVARSKAKKKDCSDGNNSDSKDGNATNTDTNAGTNGNSASSDNDSNKNSNDCEECEAVTYGSAQIYMLSSKKIKVMLVPVVQNATDNNLNIDDLKTKVSAANDIINQRFAPLGRQFELVVDGAFEYKDIDPNTGFNVSEDNSEWTKETEEMKALRKAYGLEVGKRDEYQACLFLLTQAQKEGLQGYMPRSNSVGFIFLGDNFANVQSDIMAHELCHGLFGLQHTFAYAGVTEGDVKENLMDYVAHNDERYLSKYFQWNNMERFNGHVFKLLDDVEDGEFSTECAGIITTFVQNVTNTLKNSFYGDPAEFKPENVRTVVEAELNKEFVGVEFTKDPIQMILAVGAFSFSNTSTAFGCYCEMVGIDNPYGLYADLVKAASDCYTKDQQGQLTPENFCRECVQNVVWPIADEALKKVPGYGQVYNAARTAIDWTNIISDAVNSFTLTEEQKSNGKKNIEAYNKYLEKQKEKNMVDMLTSGIVGAFDFAGQKLSSTTWPRIEIDLCDFLFDEGYDENLKATCKGAGIIIESHTAKGRRNNGIEKLVVVGKNGSTEYNTDAIPDRDGNVNKQMQIPIKSEFEAGVTGWEKIKDAVINGGTGNKFTRLQGRANYDMFKYTLEPSCDNEWFEYEISYYQYDPNDISKQELKTMRRTCSCLIPITPDPEPDPKPEPTPITKYDDCSGTNFFPGTAYSEQEAQTKANQKRIDFECHNKIPKCAGPWKKIDDYTYSIDAYVGAEGNIVKDLFIIRLSKKNDINSFISCEMDIEKAKQNQWKVIHYEDCIVDEIIKGNGDVEPIDEFFSEDALYRLIYITRQTLGETNKTTPPTKIKSTLHSHLMEEQIQRKTAVNNGSANAKNYIGHFVDVLNEKENNSEEIIRETVKPLIASSFIADRKDGLEKAIIFTTNIMNSVTSSQNNTLSVLEWFLYELYKGELEAKGLTTDSNFRECFFKSYINPKCVSYPNTTLLIMLSTIDK